jgi:hypothetical protein
MVEPRSENPGSHRRANSLTRSPSFKYYIHDSIGACRLQLIGELTDANVSELNGCWRTAKTSLGHRKLVLDLRNLKTVDDAGTRWLAWMSSEGACYLPESYLRTGLGSEPGLPTRKKSGKSCFFGRLVSFLRGARVAAAD